MFNLIVTILALVLMIGAAIAGLTYLGPAFTNSQTKATVAAMLNGAEQFQGAEALYKSDNGGVYALAPALSPTYLSQAPITPSAFASGTGWLVTPSTDGTTAALTLDMSGNPAAAKAVCALVSSEVGVGSAPYSCDSYTAPTKFIFAM